MNSRKAFYPYGLITIIALAVISSCGSGTKKATLDPILSLKPEITKVENPESWSFAIKDIEFIILEPSQNSMIKQINKIVVDSKYYYILDKNILLVFDKKGKFIKALPDKGKVPGEATKIHDFCISPEGDLCILSVKGNIIVYQSLLYSKEYQAIITDQPISPVNIQINEKYTYYWMNRFGFPLSKNESKKLLIVSEINNNNNFSYFNLMYFSSKMSRFNQSGMDYLVTPPLGSDTILTISKNGIQPYMAIDFGKFSSSKQGVQITREIEDPYPLISDLKKQNLVGELMYAVKNENYTSVLFPNPITETYCNLVVQNNTKINKVISVMPFENVFYPGIIYSANNNLLFSSKDSYLIKDCINKSKTKCSYLPEKRRLELLNKLKDVKETDNPVLMIITTKDQTNEER